MGRMMAGRIDAAIGRSLTCRTFDERKRFTALSILSSSRAKLAQKRRASGRAPA